MSYRNYQNKQNDDQNNDLLDDLYGRLSQQDRESEQDITSSLSRSIKSMSRKWLQEAYIDGMMLAEKLNRVTSDAKQNLDDFSEKNILKNSQTNSKAGDADSKIAQIVRQELQKLGLVQSKPEPKNSFPNFAFGLILILSGFFIIGGAVGYYGLDNRVASFVDTTYNSLTGNKTNAPSQNLALTNPKPQLTLNPNSNLKPKADNLNVATLPSPTIAQAQVLDSQTTAPEQSAPVINAPSNVAANSQNLTSQAPNKAQTSPTNASNPVSAKALPASCNGKQPVLNRPLNIKNPDDRAVLYCILDLQGQGQAGQATTTSPSQNNAMMEPQNQNKLPNPSQIPQR